MENDDKYLDFYNQLESPFEQSDAELWDKIEKLTLDQSKVKTVYLNFYKYAAAVVILVLFGTGFFMKWYTITVHSQKGEHLSHSLPDGSTVEVNAETTLSYSPYWWRFDRNVNLSGEAFFEVEKGKTFTIASENGSTEVLGTSFNIYARNSEYKVFCKTGRVKVSSNKSNVDMIVQPGELATIDNRLAKGYIHTVAPEHIIGWKENKFTFRSEQLQKVIQELERQYNINITLTLSHADQLVYTGYFTKSISAASALELICKSFNLTYEKLNHNSYKIHAVK